MIDHYRTSGLALWLHRAAGALIVALPVVVAYGFAQGMRDPEWLAGRFPDLPDGTVLTAAKSSLVLMIGALQLAPMLYALAQMRGLFGRYCRGEVLTDVCAGHIRQTGLALAVLGVLQVVALPLQVIVLTADNGQGGKQLVLALTSETVWLLMAAGLLVVIGRAMREAARVAEENRGFV